MRYFLRVTRRMLLPGVFVFLYAQAPAQVLANSRLAFATHQVPDKSAVTLRDLLVQLKNKYRVNILFEDRLVNQPAHSSLLENNATLEQNLTRILRPSDLHFKKVSEGVYVIVKRRKGKRTETAAQPESVDEKAPIVDTPEVIKAIGSPLETAAPKLIVEDKVVTGRVVDEKEGGLPGVSVVVKNTTRGTTTDADGKFRLAIPEGNLTTLVFSFVGYVSQEMVVGNQTHLAISLQVDLKSLEEVVVIGYGTQKKANLTGAVSTVNFENDAINSRSTTNVSTMLAGMSSGIRVQQVNGLPSDNNNSSLTVRGVGSLNNSSAPLVVIDGQVADINSVSPNDVATVTVLKDAASAAIYGSRASNGVILITTKNGRDTQGKVTFTYNNFVGNRTPAQVANLVGNSPDYMYLVNMMYANSGLAAKFTPQYIEEWREGSKTDPIRYPNTNWLEAMIQRNTVINHNFSGRGGNEKINFYSSFDYFKDNGLVPNTGFRRINFRNNLSYQINKWLKLGNNVTVISTKAEPATVDDAFMWIRATTPAVVPKHPDGRYGSGQLLAGEGGSNNGLMSAENRRGETKGTQLQGKLFAVLTPFKGLSITGSYFTDLFFQERWTGTIYTDMWNFQTEKVGIDRTTGTRLSLTNTSRKNHRQVYDLYADYAVSFGKHNLQVLGGFNQEQYITNNFSASRSDLLSYNTPVLDAAANDPQAGGNASDFSIRSFFGRASYNFNRKYMLETNLRYDGSSRFAPDRRWGLFPSVSAGWMVSAEDFWNPLSHVINDFKVRASWGKLGNNGIGNYEWQEFYQAANYNFNGTIVPGLVYSDFGNPIITWESTNVLNIGADIRLFNTLNLDLNYYNKETGNILANLPIPLVNGGIGAPRMNAAQVQNRGFEAEIKYQRTLGRIALNFGANMGYNRNRILTYKGSLIEPRAVAQAWTEGQPIGIYWVREIDRIIQAESEVKALVDQGYTFHPSTPGVGDFLYRDANGDKAINDNDRVLKGNPIPLITYGGTFGASMLGFDFNLYFDGVGKWDRYLQGSLYSLNHQEGYQWPQEYMNAWTSENRSTTIPKVYFNNPKNDQSSDYFLKKADYLKIRSLQLGYTLPATLIKQIKLTKFRVFANLENYFTFTKWPTMDPEVVPSGYDQTYPLSRTFSMGLSVSF